MRILILEDDPIRMKIFNRKLFNHTIDHAEHAADAIDFLKANKYDLIFLDHDLGDTQINFDPEDCGMLVAQYIAANNIETPVIIHSFNVVAAGKMLELLTSATYAPGIWNKLNTL